MTTNIQQKIKEIKNSPFSEELKQKAENIYLNKDLDISEANIMVLNLISEEVEKDAQDLNIEIGVTDKDVQLAKDVIDAQKQAEEELANLAS